MLLRELLLPHMFYTQEERGLTIIVYAEHTCSPDIYHDWAPAQSVQYLASNHTAAFNIDHIIKPSQIRNVKLQNGNQVTYKQSWRTLKKIEQRVLSDEAKFFKEIPFFLNHLSARLIHRLICN